MVAISEDKILPIDQGMGLHPSMGLLADLYQQGDLVPNLDFQGFYSTVLEDWLGLDAKPIVKGAFEKPLFI